MKTDMTRRGHNSNLLSSVRSLRIQLYRKRVQQWADEQRIVADRHAAPAGGAQIEVDPHTLEELRGLGYLQ